LATGRVGNVAQYLVGAAIGVGVGGGVGSGPGADEDLEAAVLGARHPRANRLQSVSQSVCARVRFWSLEPDAVDGGQACSLAAAAPYATRRFLCFGERAPPQFYCCYYSTMHFHLVLLGG
jgi:hypothetical protein